MSGAPFRWITLRHLLHEWPRTLLTVLGVALGVGVFVSIRLANHSALASFSDSVDAVAGRANLQVGATGEGFDERVFPALAAIPGVRGAAPVVQVDALAAPGGPAGPAVLAAGESGRWKEALHVLGLDPFLEGPFTRWPDAARDTAARRAALSFLLQPRAVAVTRALAERHGLGLGDTLTVLASGRPVPLVIGLVLESEELQRVHGGNLAIVDIATAQEAFGRAGRLDRVDLLVDPDGLEAVADRIRAVLPPDAEVETPEGRTRQVEGMVRAFGLNLTALSFIAVFVATFLIFNAVGMSVLRRRREIGALRALGLTRGATLRLFLAEGLAVGAAGTALGFVFGTALARLTLGAVSRTLHDLYLVQRASTLQPDAPTYVAGAALGLAVSALSALAPALEAAATAPSLTLRQGALLDARRLRPARWAAAGGALLALAVAVAWWTVRERQPLGGFVAAFLVLAGFALSTPAATLAIETAAGPLLRRVAGIEAALGARYLREAVARTSAVTAALMVAVGMMVALTVMVGSFRRTVDTWIGQTIRGDLYVEPVGHRLNGSATALPRDLVDGLRDLPGVRAVDTYRGARITYGGRLATMVGVDFEVQRDVGHLGFRRGASRAVLDAARRGDGAIVTESFAHHHRVREGDTLALAVPGGVARLPVAGVFYDYSTDAGAVLVDRRLYARLWRDDRVESFALYLEPGADADATRAALLERVAGRVILHVIPNRALRERVLTVFDQTFQVTWALQGIAVIVSVLGVISALTALILQRGREIGTLRAIGALRAQVRRMVLAESALLGLVGSLLGCACGMALALVLVHVIHRQFFGWSIRLAVDPWVFVQAVALMVAVSMLAGLGPARLASGRLAAEAMREE